MVNGKFKLRFPPSCSFSQDHGRSSAFSQWEELSLPTGEFGFLFYNGQASGYAVPLVSIDLVCTAGTHAVGVVTVGYADGDGLSFEPNAMYPTSVGLADGYGQVRELHQRGRSCRTLCRLLLRSRSLLLSLVQSL